MVGFLVVLVPTRTNCFLPLWCVLRLRCCADLRVDGLAFPSFDMSTCPDSGPFWFGRFAVVRSRSLWYVVVQPTDLNVNPVILARMAGI